MTVDLLFDVPCERQPITGKALIPLPRLCCPRCGSDLQTVTSWQPALFTACGYGATLESHHRRCLSCGWATDVERTEVNPRPFR